MHFEKDVPKTFGSSFFQGKKYREQGFAHKILFLDTIFQTKVAKNTSK
jgi:hypothetical protein